MKQVRTNEKRAFTKLLNGARDLMEENTSPSVVKTYRPLILSQLRACELAHELYVESDEFEPTSFEQLTTQTVIKHGAKSSEHGIAGVVSRAVDQQATVALTLPQKETSGRPTRRSSEVLRGELLQERWKNEHLSKLIIESGHKRQELANQVEQLERELRQRELEYRQQSERYDQERRLWQAEQSARMQALISRVSQI